MTLRSEDISILPVDENIRILVGYCNNSIPNTADELNETHVMLNSIVRTYLSRRRYRVDKDRMKLTQRIQGAKQYLDRVFSSINDKGINAQQTECRSHLINSQAVQRVNIRVKNGKT